MNIIAEYNKKNLNVGDIVKVQKSKNFIHQFDDKYFTTYKVSKGTIGLITKVVDYDIVEIATLKGEFTNVIIDNIKKEENFMKFITAKDAYNYLEILDKEYDVGLETLYKFNIGIDKNQIKIPKKITDYIEQGVISKENIEIAKKMILDYKYMAEFCYDREDSILNKIDIISSVEQFSSTLIIKLKFLYQLEYAVCDEDYKNNVITYDDYKHVSKELMTAANKLAFLKQFLENRIKIISDSFIEEDIWSEYIENAEQKLNYLVAL